MECHSDYHSGYSRWLSAMVLELYGTSESSGVLITNTVCWTPPHFWLSKSMWALRICTSNQFSSDSDAARLCPYFKHPGLVTKSVCFTVGQSRASTWFLQLCFHIPISFYSDTSSYFDLKSLAYSREFSLQTSAFSVSLCICTCQLCLFLSFKVPLRYSSYSSVTL